MHLYGCVLAHLLWGWVLAEPSYLVNVVRVTHPPYLSWMGYVPEKGAYPILFMKPIKYILTMMIPSIKQMFLFFTLNFLLIAFFNILLFKSIDFITHVRFYDILMINILKIVMLVSVYILSCFILNLLFFALLFKSDFKRTLLSTVRMNMGIFLAGIIFAVVIILVRRF